MDYSDLESQGFLIYCICLKKYKKDKASFSTFLFQNLSGRLCAYCKQKVARECLDVFDCADWTFEEFIDSCPARESTPVESFLQYAYDYISTDAYKLLKWLVYDHLFEFRSKNSPSLNVLSKKLSIPLDKLRVLWQEIAGFWDLKGAGFYAST
jgi:hypothetical protein